MGVYLLAKIGADTAENEPTLSDVTEISPHSTPDSPHSASRQAMDTSNIAQRFVEVHRGVEGAATSLRDS